MRELSSRILAWALATTLAVPPGLSAVPPAPETPPPASAVSRPDGGEPAPPAGFPPGTPRDWWSQVQADIGKSEYRVTWQERTLLPDGRAAYQAPNRAQNLRTYFTEEGIWWVPRTAEAPWLVGLSLTGLGAGGSLALVGEAKPEASGNRVEYRRNGITEWYVNDERGVEQGFTVARRPVAAEAQEPLRLVLSVSGNTTPRLSEDGRAVEFMAPGGAQAMRYADLVVTDARGRQLASRMELSECSGAATCAVQLVTEDAGATYPLTVDPLATTPNWTAESNQESASFGFSVGTAGDVNGDGYADVIASATGYDNGQWEEGRAFVYHGSALGLSATPNWTAESDQTSAYFGRSVGAAGDVNGDGYADVIVGAPYFTNGQEDEGRAYVYHGSAAGLSATASWTAESNQATAIFGWSVAAAGDVNRDGYGDVIVGAQQYDNGQVNEGRAYVYHGSASGLSVSSSWTAESDQASAYFGCSVGTAGDVNADGYVDVIVGASGYDNAESNEGRAYVYHGSNGGLGATPSWTAEGDQAGAELGISAGTAGDVNGDGYADVIVGASGYDNLEANEGRAHVYLGTASGLAAAPTWTAESDQGEARFGHSAGTAGDVNGDGFADVIVGAPFFDYPETDEGRVYVYQGSAAGLSTAPKWTADSDQADARFGYSVATAGDVNGDGFADAIMGASSYDNGEANEGRAYAYHGSASGLMTGMSWLAESDQASAAFGYSVGAAGDVNGDGYADVIVSAPNYDNGETDEGRVFVYHGSTSGLALAPSWARESDQAGAFFGYAVGTAGDANGDGYADVIVGAIYYDNGQTSEGRTFVYHGSAAGLAATPAWTAESDQAVATFGNAVGTAGDVNGDGYADVIVGASLYNNGEGNEGRAYVYQGSAAGLSLTPNWIRESDQAGALFGSSVGTAGDVNGDGYADVIVGAYRYTNGELGEGRAYVYHGSAAGLSLTPGWTGEGDQADAHFGYSAGTAGDVNGDGYADVIVGAPDHEDGEAQEGRAQVYHGSAAGLSPGTNWTADGNRASAAFGSSVGTAGDVNGDGYADVIVGAPYDTNGGRARVYHGSTSGLSPAANWTAEGVQASAAFGLSAGTAGDVNGDGFADVTVGAPNFSSGETNEGRAFLYYGNAAGALVRLRQTRSDGTTIQPWGASWNSSGFQVRMRCSTPFGLGRVRLQIEACPNGTPFGAPACSAVTSTAWAGSGASLAQSMSGLAARGLYRWRARALHAPYSVSRPGITAPPNPAHGPWRRLFAQALEADVRVLDPDLIFADGFETAPFAEADEEDPDGGGER